MLHCEEINFIKEVFKDCEEKYSLKDAFAYIIDSYIRKATCKIVTTYNGYDIQTIHNINDIVSKFDIEICDDGTVEIYGDARGIDYIKNHCQELFYEIKNIKNSFFEIFNYLLDKEEYILC